MAKQAGSRTPKCFEPEWKTTERHRAMCKPTRNKKQMTSTKKVPGSKNKTDDVNKKGAGKQQ
jgi:hypothetical protein